MTDEKTRTLRMQSKTPLYPEAEQIREQAERKAQSLEQPDFSAMTPEAIRREFHALQVKRLEAGLQNEQLLSRLEEMDDQAALFRLVNENMLDMVSVTDTEGNYIFAGKSHEIMGYERDFLIGKNVMDFVHPEDLPGILEEFAGFVESGLPRKVEYRNRCRDGTYLWLETVGKFIEDEHGVRQKIIFNSRNITERKYAEDNLKKLEWMLSDKAPSTDAGRTERFDQGYGDLTELNRDGMILKSIGREQLYSIASDYLELLGTSSAIYEVNGDYALGIFSSGWCRMLDRAARDLCNTPDNAEALNSGRWLCHESCWSDCSRKIIADCTPMDIACNGGIRLYGVPIIVNGKVAGAINFGYGDPPKDPEELRKIADTYHIDYDDLVREAHAYDSRPPFIIELAKKRLHASARIIGSMIETKQAEDALEHAYELMRYIIEHANSAVAVHDIDLSYIYVSQQYLEMYGVRETDVIGKHHYDVFPDLPDKWRDVHQKALAGRVSRSERDSYPRKDGSLDWTRWECRPWYKADGSIGGIVVYTEIITERVAAEEALRQSENYYRTIFETSGAAMIIIENDTTISRANSHFAELSGYSARELEWKKSWTEFIHTDDVARMKESHHLRRRDPDAAPRRYEFRFITRHGDMRYILLVVDMIPGTDQSVASCIDITERRKAEESLAEQHALIEAIYRNTPLIMMVVDKDRRLRQVNGFATQFSGRSAEEMLGMRGGEALRCLHALDDPRGCGYGDACKACSIRSKVLETLESGRPNLQIEVPFDFTSGNDTNALTFLISTTPISFQGQSMALVTIMDITARKQAEKEREKLQAQLNQAQKMESVGRLAGGVAHDFNNKLSIINGYAEMALDMMDPSDPLRESIRHIYTAGNQSAGIVRQLLAFARQQTISPVLLDLNDTLSGMLKMLQRLIGENIDLAWHPGAGLWPVKIDPSQVDQVMANLAVNSRDAISDVGNLIIETKNTIVDEDYAKSNTEATPGRYVMLAVSDDGCGMEAAVMDQLFEPFFTTKEIGKGTGLGLPTVYGIVKQNKGFVNVYSEPGEGTTFRIYLPSHETEDGILHSANEPGREVPTGSETILLVEDEPAILAMGKEMTVRLGYTVLTAENPNHALQVVLEHEGSIDLLITDVVMPGMNGRDLASRLSEGQPGLKTLYMSGYTADVIAYHGVLDEDVMFIQKPFSMQDLAVKIREVIEQE